MPLSEPTNDLVTKARLKCVVHASDCRPASAAQGVFAHCERVDVPSGAFARVVPCSLFVTRFAHDSVFGVFPVMCPGEETGAGLAPACWPDQKPVRPWGVTRHSPAASGLHPQTGTGVVPQPGLEVVRMLADELDFVVGVDPHRDSHAVAVVEVRSGVVVFEASVAQAAAATARLCVWLNSTRRGGARSRSRAPARLAPA